MDFDLVIDHPLQREIFKKLTYAAELRFSDMRPERIETNLFNYHLKQLMKNGFVEKCAGGYRLTAVGQAFADKLSYKNFRFRIQPKIVNILAIERDDGRWLLYERLHQPYINRLGFPSGKIHYGESIKDAMTRETKEKTGLDTPMMHRGDMYLVVRDGETVISHILGHVFHAKVAAHIDTEHQSRDGRTFWADWQDQDYAMFIPGFKEILGFLDKDRHFFEQLDFDIGDAGA